MRAPLAALLPVLVLILGVAGRVARAEDPPDAGDEARKAAVDDIRKDLKRWVEGGHAAEHKTDILKAIESLEAIGGELAAKSGLEAIAFDDKDVRDRAFALAEREHPKSLVKPLVEMLDDRRFKRDFDVHGRVAHALSVIGDPGSVDALTGLLQSEDAGVVAAAADALATFASAPHRVRLEPVKRLIDLYESTWNLMNSVRPEDRVPSKHMRDRWEVYGKAIRAAMQALTRQTLTRPHEWRRWWNDNKKKDDW